MACLVEGFSLGQVKKAKTIMIFIRKTIYLL